MTKQSVLGVKIDSLREIVVRIEKQNNKDHERIMKKQDETNGSLKKHDDRIQHLEDWKTNRKEFKSSKYSFARTLSSISIAVIALVALLKSFGII